MLLERTGAEDTDDGGRADDDREAVAAGSTGTGARTTPKRRPSPGARPRPGRPAGRPRPLPVAHRVLTGPAPAAPVLTPKPPHRHQQRRPVPHRPTTVASPTPPESLREWLPRTWQWSTFLVVATLATIGLHLWRVSTSYDLFIDEPFYAQVGQSIARGGMPFATGSPFFLHPPGFFLVEAAWMHLFGGHTSVFASVFSLRKLVGVVAGLTALMLGLLVAKVAGRAAAVLVVLGYLFSAFANDQSSMVLLEPITLFWTIAGYTVFAHLDQDDGPRRRRQVLAGALLFGIACLSKEFAVFVTLLPLGIAFVTRTWLTRREAVRAVVVTCVPWGVWLVVVAVNGYWSQFFAQITSGYHRTTGSTQISGFNTKNAPSFLDTILANLGQLWTAYTVLGIGTFAIGYVFWTSKDRPRLRFLSLFGVGAVPLLAYCVLLGTNEEQFFNFLFFPALICLVIAVRANWRRIGRTLRVALLVLVAAAALSDTAVYLDLHLGSDNGTYLVDRWMYQHVPDGTAVGTTNPVQREIFLRYAMVDDAPGKHLGPHVQYLVVFDKQVDQGYAFVDHATVARQTRNKPIVFETTDRSNGRMVIYALH